MKATIEVTIRYIYEVDSKNYIIYGPEDKEKPIETEDEFEKEIKEEVDNGDLNVILENADLEIMDINIQFHEEKESK